MYIYWVVNNGRSISKKCKMVSMFTQPDVNTQEVGRTRDKLETTTRSGVVSSLSSVLPTSRAFTSGYVNMETILHFSYKITNERGTKTMFTYTHVKWLYSQSECAYYLNYFISCGSTLPLVQILFSFAFGYCNV